MNLFRELEKIPTDIIIESLEGMLRGDEQMYINNQWLEEPEIKAHIWKLEAKIKELEEENKQLREVIAKNTEEEYD